jgi:hypothetical protein
MINTNPGGIGSSGKNDNGGLAIRRMVYIIGQFECQGVSGTVVSRKIARLGTGHIRVNEASGL